MPEYRWDFWSQTPLVQLNYLPFSYGNSEKFLRSSYLDKINCFLTLANSFR